MQLGYIDGKYVGDSVGYAVGNAVGYIVGYAVGNAVGNALGKPVGEYVGMPVGDAVWHEKSHWTLFRLWDMSDESNDEGASTTNSIRSDTSGVPQVISGMSGQYSVGENVGTAVGNAVGNAVGTGVGNSVGNGVGSKVGTNVGNAVGVGVVSMLQHRTASVTSLSQPLDTAWHTTKQHWPSSIPEVSTTPVKGRSPAGITTCAASGVTDVPLWRRRLLVDSWCLAVGRAPMRLPSPPSTRRPSDADATVKVS